MAWTSDALATERLTLRPFGQDDTEAVKVILTDADARRHLGGPVELPDDFSAAPFADQWGAWCIATRSDNAAIGSCTLERKQGSLELSYNVIPSAQGNGYAFEACEAVVDWVWVTTDEPSIIAVTQTANVASMRLLCRLGFTEGHRFEENGVERSMQYIRRPPDQGTES